MADETLSAELDLSIEAALSSVDTLTTTLSTSLDDSASGFADSLSTALDSVAGITVPVDADATAIPAEIEDTAASVGVTVPVDADTADASAELEQLSASAPAIQVPVDADTTDAQAAIDDLGSAAAGAGSSVDSASHSTEHLGEAAGLTAGAIELSTGNVRGLTGELGGMSSGMGAVVGVGGAVAATVGEIAQKGIEATSATQRFHQILGPTASAMEQIHVGNLSIGFDELASKMGDTRSAFENTTATLFQFAINSGASREKSAQFSQELLALASRAVALNPSLGSVSDVADTMAARLARGGRFAASFGVALTSTEINARALSDTGKQTASDLTIYEKSAAAAELATTKYGSSLKQAVDEGSKNAAIQARQLKAAFNEMLESIGRPLVTPIFDAIRASLPVFAEFATAVASVAVSALPVLTSALQAVTPALQVLSEVLQFLAPVIPPVVEGFIAFKAATIAGEAIQALGISLGLLPGELTAAAEVNALFAASELEVGAAAETEAVGVETATAAMDLNPIFLIASALGAAAVAFGLFGGSADSSKAKVDSFTKALEDANGKLDESASKAARGLLEERHQMDDLAKGGVTLSDVLSVTNNTSAKTNDALQQASTATGLLGHSTTDMIAIIKQTDPALAKLLTQLQEQGQLNPGLIATIAQLSAAHRESTDVLHNRSAAQANDNELQKAGAAANQENTSASALAAQGAANLAKETAAAGTTFNDALTASVNYALGIGTAKDAEDALKTATQALNTELDFLLGRFLTADESTNNYKLALMKLGDQLLASGFSFDANTQKGLENRNALDQLGTSAITSSQNILSSTGNIEAARVPLENYRGDLTKLRDVLAASGDTSGAAFVQGIIDSVNRAIEEMKTQAPAANEAGQEVGNAGAAGVDTTVPAWIQAGLNAGMAGALGVGSAAPAHAAAGQQAGQAGAQGTASTAGAHQAAGQGVGQAATTGLGAGMAGMPGVAQTNVLNSVNAAALEGANAHNIGYGIGASFSAGIGDGINANTGYIQAMARAAVQSAKAAADSQAKSASPSRLFMETGANMAAGMALGIESGTADVTRAMAGLVVVPPTPTGGGGTGVTLSQQSIEQLARAITINTGPGRGGGVVIENATFGTQDVLSDLEWFARTRMAGV